MLQRSPWAKTRSIWPRIAIAALILVVLAACSSRDEVGQTTPGAANGATPTVAGNVVEEPPGVAAGTGEASASLVDEDPERTSTRSEAVLAESDFASVVSLRAGEPVEDVAGDVLTAYGVHRLPDDLLDQLQGRDLFGNAEAAFETELQPAIVDLGMCAAGGVADASAVEFSLFGNDFDEYVERPTVFINHAIAHPPFVLPDPGECSRGWLLVLRESQSPRAVRYLVSKRGDDGAVERHLYQWSVPFTEVLGDASPAAEIEAEPSASDRFFIGQVVTFNEGPLARTTVTFNGWAEVAGGDTTEPDTRLVAVLAEVCTATEDWPEFGLGIDGWNLLAPIDPADRLGADAFSPLTGNCFEDWIEFGVPFGATPSSFFVADGVDPVNGYAEWTLSDAAIAPPS